MQQSKLNSSLVLSADLVPRSPLSFLFHLEKNQPECKYQTVLEFAILAVTSWQLQLWLGVREGKMEPPCHKPSSPCLLAGFGLVGERQGGKQGDEACMARGLHSPTPSCLCSEKPCTVLSYSCQEAEVGQGAGAVRKPLCCISPLPTTWIAGLGLGRGQYWVQVVGGSLSTPHQPLDSCSLAFHHTRNWVWGTKPPCCMELALLPIRPDPAHYAEGLPSSTPSSHHGKESDSPMLQLSRS